MLPPTIVRYSVTTCTPCRPRLEDRLEHRPLGQLGMLRYMCPRLKISVEVVPFLPRVKWTVARVASRQSPNHRFAAWDRLLRTVALRRVAYRPSVIDLPAEAGIQTATRPGWRSAREAITKERDDG